MASETGGGTDQPGPPAIWCRVSGDLEPVLETWWQSFSGPFLYYPGRRLVPPPLRAFIVFVRSAVWTE